MRNQYLDLLRAAAVLRVVIYHVTGWSALTIVFPAMSVMVALGGSMMAASLDRSGPFAVKSRLRRLLPSLWVLSRGCWASRTTMDCCGTAAFRGWRVC